jgi:hypothetical protein
MLPKTPITFDIQTQQILDSHVLESVSSDIKENLLIY